MSLGVVPVGARFSRCKEPIERARPAPRFERHEQHVAGAHRVALVIVIALEDEFEIVPRADVALEVPKGEIVAIVGANGSGKTSVLETIQAVLKGGNDATLLREGAAKGEAVLVLDDGTEINAKPVSIAQVDEGNAKSYSKENWGALPSAKLRS